MMLKLVSSPSHKHITPERSGSYTNVNSFQFSTQTKVYLQNWLIEMKYEVRSVENLSDG